MKRLGYVFKKDAWMEVQAPGFRYYHKLAKLDEMFSEDMLKHHVDMPWMAKPYFLFVGYQGIAQSEAVTIPEEVLCKAIQIKNCRAEAFCGWWSKVYRGFEKVSSVTGRISADCK